MPVPPPPEYNTDYTLIQNGAGQLNLTLKKAFLQKNEWGKADLNPSITIYSKEGRKFLTHSFKLRVNTPPPNLEKIDLVKTTGSPSYYVLCFKAEGIGTKVNGLFLHGDGYEGSNNKLKLLIRKGNEPEQPHELALTSSGVGTNSTFIGNGGLSTLDGTSIPPGSDVSNLWTIRYKTDVVVDTGAAVNYTIRLKDKKGLESNTVTSGTQLPHPTIKFTYVHEPDNYITSGIYSTGSDIIAKINETNSTALNPIKIYTAYNDMVTLEAFGTYGPGVVIRAELNGIPVQYASDIELTANESGADYKLELWAEGGGFTPSKKITYYYKVFNTIKATNPNIPVWGILKKAVNKRDSITIDGTIKASDSPDNNKGEIIIQSGSASRTVSIKGINNAAIDADRKNRIFYMSSWRLTLNLKDITLTNGKADRGGAINCGQGPINFKGGCIISNNTATVEGGAIHGRSSTINFEGGCKISNNTSPKGKDIYLYDNSKLYIKDRMTVDSGNQIYIKPSSTDSYSKFYITGEQDITNPINIKIDAAGIDELKNKPIIEGSGYTLKEEDIEKFELYNNGYIINLDHEVDVAVLSKIYNSSSITNWAQLQNAITNAPSGAVIKLGPGTITAGSDSSELTVSGPNKTLTIIGSSSGTTIGADNKHRVFVMEKSNIKLKLKNLTITKGKHNDVDGKGGAGIYVKAYTTGSLTLVNTKVDYNTVNAAAGPVQHMGAGIMIENASVKVFIIGGSISNNKIDCSTTTSTATTELQGCGLYLGNSSTTVIKGNTQIKNNSYTKRNDNKTVTCYGAGIYLTGSSKLTIGENGADDGVSPTISGHSQVSGTTCHGTAIAIAGGRVDWLSGRIINNGGSTQAVYNSGGTFNANGHTAN
ncbi:MULTISPECIES: hypothetical protein [unclassified Treponema]|uniref:hypothetical protein n=1 Tax=unclassified Treponema TaxID=2638727 RepID=UPI0020A4FD4C|nr:MULTISPECIES: hypothetical protein [unclassified Treponema]